MKFMFRDKELLAEIRKATTDYSKTIGWTLILARTDKSGGQVRWMAQVRTGSNLRPFGDDPMKAIAMIISPAPGIIARARQWFRVWKYAQHLAGTWKATPGQLRKAVNENLTT